VIARYALRPINLVLEEAGLISTLLFEGFRHTAGVRKWWREFVEQAWFFVSVTSAPVFMISIPLGATIALQVGDIARQLGAESATGAVIVAGVVREVAPVAAAVLIAGAGGSAISADMGARNIRSELDAMEVMGVNPIQRLVTPRIWAASLISMLLVSLVILSGLIGGFVFNVLLQGVSPGAFFFGATLLVQLPDLLQALVKAWIFGVVAAVVASAKGMTCASSPVGVGRAVNRAVVETFILVMALNYVISTLYITLWPPRIS
jgi:phospholipid/cholesterol/gamma-HCH transport system permease protein